MTTSHMKTTAYTGRNTDGTTFTVDETPYGDYAVFIVAPDDSRHEFYRDSWGAAIQILIDNNIIDVTNAPSGA